MSAPSVETLASAWAQIAEEVEFPANYEGTATPEAHQASEALQERIREHIVAAEAVIRAVPSSQEDVMTIAQRFEQRGRLDERFAIAKGMLAEGADEKFVKRVTKLSDEDMSQLRLH